MFDFSKHEYIKMEDSMCSIYTLKLPGCEYTHRVNFSVVGKQTLISGDFGLWAVNLGMHGNRRHSISEEYFLEKLSASNKDDMSAQDKRDLQIILAAYGEMIRREKQEANDERK